MKKLIFILTFLVAGIAVFGQSERVIESDLKIKATTPRLYLQGLGGTILIQGATSGTMTLRPYAAANGTIVFPSSASTDTLSTQAYSRAHGGGSMVYPGAGIALSSGAAWGASITNNSTNWNTAYTDRLKWDGGDLGLVATTGRTSLGGTTVGQSFFTLANPTAIRFPQILADNSVVALTAAAFTTAIGAGTVKSVTATLTAGALTDVTLTGVTTKPYHIMIQTTAGKDITSAVSDSLGISGGIYHLYVYSVDLITNAEIKVTH
jgi:hypothetical protein